MFTRTTKLVVCLFRSPGCLDPIHFSFLIWLSASAWKPEMSVQVLPLCEWSVTVRAEISLHAVNGIPVALHLVVRGESLVADITNVCPTHVDSLVLKSFRETLKNKSTTGGAWEAHSNRRVRDCCARLPVTWLCGPRRTSRRGVVTCGLHSGDRVRSNARHIQSGHATKYHTRGRMQVTFTDQFTPLCERCNALWRILGGNCISDTDMKVISWKLRLIFLGHLL